MNYKFSVLYKITYRLQTLYLLPFKNLFLEEVEQIYCHKP